MWDKQLICAGRHELTSSDHRDVDDSLAGETPI